MKTLNECMTAYCGLCCADCIPSREEFFSLLERLEELLEKLQFEKYASLKSARDSEFKNYPQFLSLLRKVKGLRCPAPCRQGGGNPGCQVRQCARHRRLEGCWQCAERHPCALLDSLRRVHPNLDYHLDLIARLGPAQWFSQRKSHYSWQQKGVAQKPSHVTK